MVVPLTSVAFDLDIREIFEDATLTLKVAATVPTEDITSIACLSCTYALIFAMLVQKQQQPARGPHVDISGGPQRYAADPE